MGERENNVSYMGGRTTLNRSLCFLSRSWNNFLQFFLSHWSGWLTLSSLASSQSLCLHIKLSLVFEAEVPGHFTAISSTACYRCYLRSLNTPALVLVSVVVVAVA